MKIRCYQFTIKTDKPFDAHAVSLRGYVGRQYPHLALLHNHSSDNSLIYTFPRVLYQVIDGSPVIIGIDEGIDAVRQIASTLTQLSLKGAVYTVKEILDFEQEVDFGAIKTETFYSFLTPWLALNEKNYEKYQRLGNWAKKKELLEKILIGNIISMSKSLGYTVPEPIKTNIGKLKEVPTSLKGTPMLGFLGTFSVNFEIPDYWGIGKSVSRGFGTVKRVEECRS
jgi:hypothetical protein